MKPTWLAGYCEGAIMGSVVGLLLGGALTLSYVHSHPELLVCLK